MGNCCDKAPTTDTVSDPAVRINNSDAAVELANFLSLDHPLNVNRKFNNFFEIVRDKHTGTEIKRTHSYKSKIPQAEIEKKRNEYWETRVEGVFETWQALRSACEADEETALAILGAMDIKLVNKTLQLAYDRLGNKYDVPIFCINNPVEFDLPKKKQIKKEELSGQVIKIKVRRTGVVNDVQLEIANNINGLELKQEYLKHANEPNLQPAGLRLFFGGREIADDSLIAEYQIQDEHVVQVFLRKQ